MLNKKIYDVPFIIDGEFKYYKVICKYHMEEDESCGATISLDVDNEKSIIVS